MDRGGGRKKFYSRRTIMFPEYWDWFQSLASDSMDPVKISRSNGGQQIFSFLSFLSSKMRLLTVSRKSHFKMHQIEMIKYDSNERKL